jgi:hypothetical protein
VLDRDGTPVSLQVFGNQSPVAVMQLVFTAKEAELRHVLASHIHDAFDFCFAELLEESFRFIGTVGRKHNVRNGADLLVVGLLIATSAGTSANAIVAARPMLVARGASLR